jgi:hypothetical protein
MTRALSPIDQVIEAVDNGTFTTDMWHPADMCDGNNCSQHILLNNPVLFEMFQAIDVRGQSWGVFSDIDEMEMLEAETDEERDTRLAAIAGREEQRRLEHEAIRQAAYVAEVAFRQQLKKQKGQKEVPKIPHPCKWLYADPEKEHVFKNSVCAECWAHDYTDAKGVHKSPRKCEYLHPDEDGWKPEWNSLPVRRDKFHIPKAAPAAPVGGTTVYMSTRSAAALAPKPKVQSAW